MDGGPAVDGRRRETSAVGAGKTRLPRSARRASGHARVRRRAHPHQCTAMTSVRNPEDRAPYLPASSRMLKNASCVRFRGSQVPGSRNGFKVRSESACQPWNRELVNQERGGRPSFFSGLLDSIYDSRFSSSTIPVTMSDPAGGLASSSSTAVVLTRDSS
jgi:hypothetical protein